MAGGARCGGGDGDRESDVGLAGAGEQSEHSAGADGDHGKHGGDGGVCGVDDNAGDDFDGVYFDGGGGDAGAAECGAFGGRAGFWAVAGVGDGHSEVSGDQDADQCGDGDFGVGVVLDV